LLLGCELGQRGEDLLNIKPSDFRETGVGVLIDIYQQKGKKHVSVPVTEKAQQILNQGFPKRISLQNLNNYIKDVVKEAGITEVIRGKKYDNESKRKLLGMYPKFELIASHTCRRSFATNYYKKVPTTVLMGITGHAKESTFLQYIGKPKDKDENAKLFLSYLKSNS